MPVIPALGEAEVGGSPLTVCVSLWTLKGLQNVLDAATIKIQWPGLHNLVMNSAA